MLKSLPFFLVIFPFLLIKFYWKYYLGPSQDFFTWIIPQHLVRCLFLMCSVTRCCMANMYSQYLFKPFQRMFYLMRVKIIMCCDPSYDRFPPSVKLRFRIQLLFGVFKWNMHNKPINILFGVILKIYICWKTLSGIERLILWNDIGSNV